MMLAKQARQCSILQKQPTIWTLQCKPLCTSQQALLDSLRLACLSRGLHACANLGISSAQQITLCLQLD